MIKNEKIKIKAKYKKNMKNYKILFLTGHRKSGTSMLHNLFDGHEDFLVYPNAFIQSLP